MRHKIKSQNASMGPVFQRLFFSGFMPTHNQCFGAKHTFVQIGHYCDMRPSIIVSFTWHLVTIRIYYSVNTAACSNVKFVPWSLDTSAWNLAEVYTCFLGESGSPAASQLLLSFEWPVRCKVAPHVHQVVPDSIKSHYLLHSFAAAMSNTISRTIATAIAFNLIMNWDHFVLYSFPARYLDPILTSVRALELWVCRGILGCIPLLTKNLALMMLIRSTGAPEELL